MFEVEVTVVLRGSGVAIASALSMDRAGGALNPSLPLTPIRLPTPLPRVPARVRVTTPYQLPLLLQLLHLLLLVAVELERFGSR